MKGKFLTKLKFITSIKHGLSLQLNPTEKTSNQKSEIPEDLNEGDEPEQPANLSDFEEKPIPGGTESVVLYSTSLRGVRKTYEDCNKIKFLLQNFKIVFYERDISMDMEFREELWRSLGRRVIPPRLFIKGRYIGGADEVVGLNEQGKLRKLMEGIPFLPSTSPCGFCVGFRFLVCSNCNGGRKVLKDEDYSRCSDCNENGLVKCFTCC